MSERTVGDVFNELSEEQKDTLYLLVGMALTEGGFKARRRMAALPINHFSAEQSRVVAYFIEEATKKA